MRSTRSTRSRNFRRRRRASQSAWGRSIIRSENGPSTTARGRTEGYPSPGRPSSTASTQFSISTSMRGPSDGCGSSSGARVRRTLWSRGTWLRTASASTRSDASSVRDSVPYRLFVECLLGRLDKGWTVEQLAAKLKTTKATIYRHINKLKEMDLLDEVNVTERSSVRKGYRIRYGNLSKAWNFVESNVEIAMENYRKTVDHLEKLAEQRR